VSIIFISQKTLFCDSNQSISFLATSFPISTHGKLVSHFKEQ